jgi:hypothetical protein
MQVALRLADHELGIILDEYFAPPALSDTLYPNFSLPFPSRTEPGVDMALSDADQEKSASAAATEPHASFPHLRGTFVPIPESLVTFLADSIEFPS